MKAARLAVVVAFIAAARAPLAHADSIKVKVVEIAGDLVYLEPGEAAGLTVGSVVELGRAKLAVIAVTAGGAAVRLGKARVQLGDRGVARIDDGDGASRAKVLPTPRPLANFRGQWPAATRPADGQHPTPVPLGAGRAPGAIRLTAWSQTFGAVARGEGTATTELGARVAYQPWRERPLAVDLDVAARLGTRASAVRVATAQARWGAADDPRIAVGRLRWASAATGMLDGARVSARFGELAVAAFGGVVPDPVDGVPEPDAARFGTELAWDHAGGAWPVHAVLTAHGSTWDGALDERRLAAAADVGHGAVSAGASVELQQFAADNPWGASALELTSATADLSWRRRGQHASLGASLMRPERSRRLDAALPADWLCARAPRPGDQVEDCAGGDLDLVATAASGLSGARWSIDGGATTGLHRGVTDERDSSLFALATLRVLPAAGRLLAGVATGRAGPIDWESGEVGVAIAPRRALALAVRYRLERLAYRASLDVFLTHQALVDADWAVHRTLDASIALSLSAGADRPVAIGLFTLIWRPWP